MQMIQFSRHSHVLALHRHQCTNFPHVLYVLSGWIRPSLDLLPFHALTLSIVHVLVNGGIVGECLWPGIVHVSILNCDLVIDALSADILKPSCPHIPLHLLPPLSPCLSPTPPRLRSPYVRPAHPLRTSGSALSVATLVVAVTVELMRTRIIKLPLISTRWS
jgi:hypothetical protein